MEGDTDAQQEFGTAFSPFWKALEDFIEPLALPIRKVEPQTEDEPPAREVGPLTRRLGRQPGRTSR